MPNEIRETKLEALMPLIRETLAAGNTVRFTPRGNSMLPMLHSDRDTVTLSPVPPRLQKYDLPLYQRENGQYVLHRVVAVGETYTCIGDNQFAREEGLTHDQMIGLVTAFTRNGREYTVTDPAYRLYCRVWHYTRLPRRLWRGLWRRLKGGAG